MYEDSFVQLVILAGTAAGLIVLGLSSIALASRGIAVRLAAHACCPAVGAAIPALAGRPTAGLIPAAAVGTAALCSALLGTAVVSNAGRRLGRAGVRAVVLSAAGGTLLVGALVRFDLQDEENLDRESAAMLEATWKPPLQVTAHPEITTDAGRPLTIDEPVAVRPADETAAAERRVLESMNYSQRVIRTAPPSDVTNCHGWVFTGGRYWLSPEDVEEILADNDYQPVSDPRPGDLVIYRQGGQIAHTAVVRANMDGGSVLAEGKWGWMGAYLHPVEGSCYGKAFTYYRSPRGGHLLVGLGGQPSRTGPDLASDDGPAALLPAP